MAGKKGTNLKPVDEEALVKLARIGASDVQLAHYLKVSVDTLARRFRSQIDAARAEGGLWALQRAHERAAAGSWPAIECLLVHLCGWGPTHAQQIVNIVQQNAIAAPPALTMSEFKRQVAEAEIFANAIFDGQPEQLTDGDRDGSPAI